MPSSRHLSRTAGQPVDTIPDGVTTCRATSDSRPVEGFVRGCVGIAAFLLGRVDRLDLLGDLQQATRQRGQSRAGVLGSSTAVATRARIATRSSLRVAIDAALVTDFWRFAGLLRPLGRLQGDAARCAPSSVENDVR
jgi:hypothetical protein